MRALCATRSMVSRLSLLRIYSRPMILANRRVGLKNLEVIRVRVRAGYRYSRWFCAGDDGGGVPVKMQATHVDTPLGPYQAPLAPNWPAKLAQCETEEDLFALVRENGMVNPDALAEVLARGLYGEYLSWTKREK